MSDEYQNVLKAHENIKDFKEKLKNDLQSVMAEIEKVQEKLAWLQNSYLPLSDLKEAIIQFLAAKGQDYRDEFIRPAISALACNRSWGATSKSQEEFGLPLEYKAIEDAIGGITPGFSACQIINPNKSYPFDDRAFFCLLFDSIEPVLRNIIENMESSEFCYDRIRKEEIGPSLEERREMIKVVAQEILTLEQKKASVISKLESLGVSISTLIPSKKQGLA